MRRTLHAIALLLLSTGLALAEQRAGHAHPAPAPHRAQSSAKPTAKPTTKASTKAPATHHATTPKSHVATHSQHATKNTHAATKNTHAATKSGHVATKNEHARSRPIARSGPVHASNGRYVFPGGVVRTYHAPVIHEHYYSYGHRPALVIENQEPVAGYMWTRGHWRWGAAEWMWTPGYWVVDPNYSVGVSVGVGIQ